MKYLKLAFAVLMLMALTGACNQSKKKAVEEPKPSEKTAKVEISYSTVEDLLQNGDSLSGKTVYVSGIIDHVCKHGGKRFKILSSDGTQEMKIELGEKFEAADPSIAGKTAKVKGTLTPFNMDAEMIKSMIEKEKKEHGEEEAKHQIERLQGIYNKIESSEIPYYTIYTVQADKYELE